MVSDSCLGEVYDLSKWRLFSRVVFHGVLPSILVGLHFALGVMWLMLIVEETVAASSRIGCYMAMNAREFMQLDIVSIRLTRKSSRFPNEITKILIYSNRIRYIKRNDRIQMPSTNQYMDMVPGTF